MRRMLMQVSLELLREILSLPQTTKIVRVETNNRIELGDAMWADLVIEDPSFDEVIPGTHLKHTAAQYRAHRSLCEFVGWSHEQEKGAANV